MARLPMIKEHVHRYRRSATRATKGFAFGLDLILDGLERMRPIA